MILHFLTADNSKISIGIAGPDIAEDGRPGHWINSVGYSSDGVSLTSHNETANTSGQSYNTGQVWSRLLTFVTTRSFLLRLVKRAVEILLKLFAGSYSVYKLFFLFRGFKSKYEFTKDLINEPISYKAHFLLLKLKIYFLNRHSRHTFFDMWL